MNTKAYVDKDKAIFDDVGKGSLQLVLVKQVKIILNLRLIYSHHQKALAALWSIIQMKSNGVDY